MSLLLNWRVWVALALAGVLVASNVTAYRKGVHHAQEVCAEERAKAERAAQEQTERNRELTRAAETKYVVQAATRDRFIVQTVREIHHDTENLAACVLAPAAVDRLRHAAECVSGEDRPASCGAGEPVR